MYIIYNSGKPRVPNFQTLVKNPSNLPRAACVAELCTLKTKSFALIWIAQRTL